MPETRADSGLTVPPDYAAWVAELKSRIQRARSRAALAVNQELVRLYHDIGREIIERQASQGWGAKVIDRLAVDLRCAFPDMKGLSASNLKYMRFFAELCPGAQIGQQPADQLPWFHIVTLLILLCKTKNQLVAEYALSSMAAPMGVAEYELVRALPEPLDTSLPTVEQLEEELSADLESEGGDE